MTGGVMPMHLIHSATAQLGHGGGEGNRLVGDILSGGQFCSRGQGLARGLQTLLMRRLGLTLLSARVGSKAHLAGGEGDMA